MHKRRALLFLILSVLGCKDPQPYYKRKIIKVTVTAYNSSDGQTWGDNRMTYWGDTLRPGMRAVAVSHDLLDSGLTYGSKIYIQGLDSTYTVLDKMNRRWLRRIDIYMGDDWKAARKWGRQKRKISWVVDTVYPE